eukprot:TRINITY_DN21424_c0_g1_i1.p1 TRINITY_DN21424_c0_g1~~TRINITY_DN21424_c0_g1_i1.p1  ORF type:complete len:216 (-),score=47.28 TRINITY_DN21424_c0_g1_i1:219-866(-)
MARLWRARQAGAAPSVVGPSGGPVQASSHGDHASEAVGLRGDIVILCGGQKFEADRCILAARSPYFNAMLSKYREADEKEVNLPDISPQALTSVLSWFYTDEAPLIQTREDAEDLLVAASRLGVSGLLKATSDYLRDNSLVVETALSLLRLADMHGASSLRSDALAVVGENFSSLKTTPEWDQMLRSNLNPSLIQDMMTAIADASVFQGRASIKL